MSQILWKGKRMIYLIRETLVQKSYLPHLGDTFGKGQWENLSCLSLVHLFISGICEFLLMNLDPTHGGSSWSSMHMAPVLTSHSSTGAETHLIIVSWEGYLHELANPSRDDLQATLFKESSEVLHLEQAHSQPLPLLADSADGGRAWGPAF